MTTTSPVSPPADRDLPREVLRTPRPDLPPIARRFNAGLLTGLALDDVDAAGARALRQLGSLLLNAIAELENEQIIARGRPAAPAGAHPAERS